MSTVHVAILNDIYNFYLMYVFNPGFSDDDVGLSYTISKEFSMMTVYSLGEFLRNGKVYLMGLSGTWQSKNSIPCFLQNLP